MMIRLFFLLLLSAAVCSGTTVYLQIGASDFITADEILADGYSPLRVGQYRVSGDPVSASAGGAAIGYAASSCFKVYLERSGGDAAVLSNLEANYPGYVDEHERHLTTGDTALAGVGGYECTISLVLSGGQLALKGFLEADFGRQSQLAVVGGTGVYEGARGEATVNAVDAGSCATAAFQAGSSAADCQLQVQLDVLGCESATQPAQRRSVRVYEHIGASQKTEFHEVDASTWKLGDRYTSGNPLYNAPGTATSSYVGYSSRSCYMVYLDAGDARYDQVHSAVGARFHPRPGAAAGRGAWLCEMTFVMPNSRGRADSVTMQGLVESRFDGQMSTLAVVGGQGAYSNSKGSATVSAINPLQCNGAAFANSSLPSSCILAVQISLVQNVNPVAPVGSFTWIELGGGNIQQNYDEVVATDWRLGNSLFFGCPLYNAITENGGQRIGWDGGYCYKVYLDAPYGMADFPNALGFDAVPYTYSGQEDFLLTMALPGFHTRSPRFRAGVDLAGAGAWECMWTSHFADGTITVEGIFNDSAYLTNYFSVLGGTGRYKGITGFMVDNVNTVGTYNQDYCVNNGFFLNSPALSCQYEKAVTYFSPAQ